MHTPKINNVINGVGGWTTGPGYSPFSYFSYQTTTTVQIPAGGQVSASGEADVYCSVVGQMFSGGPTPSSHTYPKPPISPNCQVRTAFDAIIMTGTRWSHLAPIISKS